MTRSEVKLFRRERAEQYDEARRAAWQLGESVPAWITHVEWSGMPRNDRQSWLGKLGELIERAK